MMRSWKKKRNVPIGGLLIDTLAYQFIIDWKHRDKSYFYYDYMCRDFFDYMASQSTDQEYWKALGSGQLVFVGKGQFQYKAKLCSTSHSRRSSTKLRIPKRSGQLNRSGGRSLARHSRTEQAHELQRPDRRPGA